MRLDVTIFEKSYAAFPENIEIIPEVKAVLPLQIRPAQRTHRWAPPETLSSTAGRDQKDGFQRRQNRC
jgi:hypothetical protein